MGQKRARDSASSSPSSSSPPSSSSSSSPPARPPPPRLKPQHQVFDARDQLSHIDKKLRDDELESTSSSSSPPPSSSSLPLAHRALFRSTAQQVHEFGARSLNKREKKEHVARSLESLGVARAKAIRTPLPMLQGMREKNKWRAARKAERERDSGLKPTKSSSSSSRSSSRSSSSSSSLKKDRHELGEAQVGDVMRRNTGGTLFVARHTAHVLKERPRIESLAKRMRQ